MNFTQRVADHFVAHPGQWIDGEALRLVGGRAGYRTRISDARRQFGMDIRNRLKRQRLHDGSQFVVSEYQYRPPTESPRA